MEGSTDCVVGVDSKAIVKPSCGNVIARICFDFSGMYSSLPRFQTKAVDGLKYFFELLNSAENDFADIQENTEF